MTKKGSDHLTSADRAGGGPVSPSVVWIVHTYNVLFLVSLNVVPALRLTFLSLYALYFARRWQSEILPALRSSVMVSRQGLIRRALEHVAIATPLLVVACGYLTNGYATVPNWDYYKYNYLLIGIGRDVLHPSAVWANDGQLHALTYYYSIFLPASWLAVAFRALMPLSVFDVQLLFILVNTIVATCLLAAILGEVRNKTVFLFLLFFMIGLDGVVEPFIHQTAKSWIINDIQNGGFQWLFSPMRIQNFVSYFFWLPGHTISALAACYVLIRLDKGTARRNAAFVCVPVVLFLASTSVFVVMAFCGCCVLEYLSRNGVQLAPLVSIVRKTPAMAGVVVLGSMVAFYSWHREAMGSDVLLSPHIRSIGVAKWSLFVFQEFAVFALIYWLFRPRRVFLALMATMILLSLVASRDFLMSGSILLLLMLHYHASEVASFSRAPRVMAAVALIALPTIFWDMCGVFDLAHVYPDQMSEAQAAGSEIKGMPSVIRGYIRRR